MKIFENIYNIVSLLEKEIIMSQ